jgi:hypothetical protein
MHHDAEALRIHPANQAARQHFGALQAAGFRP